MRIHKTDGAATQSITDALKESERVSLFCFMVDLNVGKFLEIAYKFRKLLNIFATKWAIVGNGNNMKRNLRSWILLRLLGNCNGT